MPKIFQMNDSIIVMSEEKLFARLDRLEKKLDAFAETKTKTQVLTSKEVCGLLKISDVTRWKMQRAGRINPLPRDHQKSKLLFNYSEIMDFVNSSPKHKRL
jgi:predicted DNA-binding transcriptional regulator AlpA